MKEPLKAVTLHAGRLREFPSSQLGPDSVVGVEAFLFANFFGNRGLELFAGFLATAPVLVFVPCRGLLQERRGLDALKSHDHNILPEYLVDRAGLPVMEPSVPCWDV